MTLLIEKRFSVLSFCLFTAGAMATVGCTEDVDSSDIRTTGMHPIYRTLSLGDGTTTVTAELRVGGDDGTYVVLREGDKLTASAADTEKTMNAIDDGLRYRTSFPIDAGGTEFNVAFTRDDSAGDGNNSAPNSKVTLPEQFSLKLTNQAEGVEIKRGVAVDIEWDPPAAGDVSWEVKGDCIWSSSGRTRDNGSFQIPAKEIEVTGTDEGESCEVTVTVDRTNVGTVDPIFSKEGGSIEATQRRTVRFVSTPAQGEAAPN